ncbi:MAG: hypothetical protein WDA59_04335 [Methanofastidiosum sp.]
MILREKEVKNKLKAKGVLVEVNDQGLVIEDEKNETKDLLRYEEFKMFIGKEISFSMADSFKEEMNTNG